MLHELLTALLGYTGDLVIDVREQSDSLGLDSPHDAPKPGERAFKLAPDISFIQPSERQNSHSSINLLSSSISHLASSFYYRELDRFATTSRDLSWIRFTHNAPVSSTELLKPKKKTPSVYRRAIANGIVEILSVYRSAVLQVEQNLLSDPVPILGTVTQGLNKLERNEQMTLTMMTSTIDALMGVLPQFDVLLPPLYELVVEIEHDDVRGGKLLNLLHKRCHCGVPELQACIQRNISIDKQQDMEVENEPSHSELLEKSIQKSPDDASLTDWHLGFHIFLIPRGMPRFQGFMAQFAFQKEPSTETKLVEEELIPQSEADKIDAMLQELKESSEFHKRSFECAVDSIRAIAASHLWQLVVIRANLNGHLKALKDYFLLAKGDFFQCFIEESRQLMRLPPRQSTAEADLMVPFQLAAIKTIGDEDKYFSRVSLRMPSFGIPMTSSQLDLSKVKVSADGNSGSASQGSASLETSLDGWDGISLEYSIDWPLQLFFTQEVLSKYRRLFQYLLRLKRTQMELEKSWASVMHQDHTDFAKHREDRKKCSIPQQHRLRSRPTWRVREHMIVVEQGVEYPCCHYLPKVDIHFYAGKEFAVQKLKRISNLLVPDCFAQDYISAELSIFQVDVIESQWNVLQSRVQDSQDFTELVGFHQEYLSALISQSFLDIGSVSRILDSIMKLCLQFCWNIENQENNPNALELEQITELPSSRIGVLEAREIWFNWKWSLIHP
ncbi:Gamma-tubulin complex component 4 [Asimina triloba]